MLLNPDRPHVVELVECDGLENGDDHHGDEREDSAPFSGGESSAFELTSCHAGGQVAVSIEIGGKPKKHEDRSNAETVVPAISLGEETAEQRSHDRSNVDSCGEDDETTGAACFILRRIESTYLRRYVPFQETRADN